MQTTQTSDLTLLTETASFYDTATQDDTFKYSNIHFETEENTSIPVSESDLEPRAIICTHNFKSGYTDLHYSQSNGGCIRKTLYGKNLHKMQIILSSWIRKHNNLRQMSTQIIACTNFNGRKLAQPNY